MKTHTSKYCSSKTYITCNSNGDDGDNDHSSHQKMNSLIQYSDLILNEALATNYSNEIDSDIDNDIDNDLDNDMSNDVYTNSSDDSSEYFNKSHTKYILSSNSTSSTASSTTSPSQFTY
jgi:hypothetical protein